MTSKARELADLLDASGNIKTKSGRTTQGRNLTNDGTKLDGIEANATADQTHSEIRALIVAGSDTNVFTDADHTKLDGIESGATADQTDAEIRAAVEAATDSNVFTDADHAKLNAIEAGATADQTNAEIRAAVEAATDSNVFTDADHSKLNAIEAGATADQTKADIDALNIDADTLDGKQLATIESEYQSYADTAAANVVDSAPAALNTLNELAAALGDDANFATTTATSLGEKLPKSGGQMTGNITMSGSQTVDGRDLSVDGAKLDGIEANAKNDQTITAGGGLTGGGTGDVTISHSDTSSQASVNGSGRTYIQDITLDTYGHVTGLATATETVVNTDTNTNQLTTFVIEDGDGTEVTISHGKEMKFVEGQDIDVNWTDTSNGSDGDPYDLTISHKDTSTLSGTYGSTSNATKIDQITVDGRGHVTAITTGAVGDIQGVTAGSGLTGGGTSGTVTISHSDTSSQGSVNNSGRTYIQDITLDTYGHITGISSATETVVNTDTNTTYSAGTNLSLSGTTFNVSANPSFTDVYVADQIIHTGDTDTYMQFDAANSWRVVTGNTERMQVNSSGIGIGNTSAGNTFGNGKAIAIGDNDTGIRQNGDGVLELWANNQECIDINTTRAYFYKNIDMGGRNVVEVEDIGLRDRIYHDDDTDTYMQFHAGNQWRVVAGGTERLEVNGGTITANGTFNNTSDERLKENVKPIQNALADICQLEGVTFDWKDTGANGQGFIAQQVEPIIPDVVNTDDDTGMKSINYVGLIGHLVEAIKTQQTQIDDLKAEIQSMKS